MAAKDRNWNNFRETFLFIDKGWIKCQINVYCSKAGRWSACIWVYGKGEHSLASGSSSYRSSAIETAIKKAGFEFDHTGDYSSCLLYTSDIYIAGGANRARKRDCEGRRGCKRISQG